MQINLLSECDSLSPLKVMVILAFSWQPDGSDESNDAEKCGKVEGAEKKMNICMASLHPLVNTLSVNLTFYVTCPLICLFM